MIDPEGKLGLSLILNAALTIGLLMSWETNRDLKEKVNIYEPVIDKLIDRCAGGVNPIKATDVEMNRWLNCQDELFSGNISKEAK